MLVVLGWIMIDLWIWVDFNGFGWICVDLGGFWWNSVDCVDLLFVSSGVSHVSSARLFEPR